MVFLNAQLFRRCLIIAEQLNVLVMGRGSSTRCSRKHSQQAWWLVRALHSSLSFLQRLFEGMRKVKHLMVNMAPVPDNAGPIYWAIVYVPQGTTPGVLNIDSTAVADIKRTQPVRHELRHSRPNSSPIRFSSPVVATSTTATASHFSSGSIHKHHGRDALFATLSPSIKFFAAIAPIEIKHAYTRSL